MSDQNKFEIKKISHEGIVSIHLDGYLDAHTAPILEEAIQGTINEGTVKIVINFADLDYISSAGLGVFMAFIEDVRNGDGDIKLSNMKPKVFSVFDLLGFPMLFDIVQDEKTAFDHFKDGIIINDD